VKTSDRISVVCPVLPTPFECSEQNKNTELTVMLAKLANASPADVTIQKAGDGTLVRLFYANGGWHKATSFSLELKKINPALCQTKSFETMFDEAAACSGLSYDRLEKDRTYFFLLEHPENIIIVQHQKARLVPVASVKACDASPFYVPSSLELTIPFSTLEGQPAEPQVWTPESLPPQLLSVWTSFNQTPDETQPKILDGPVSFVGLIATLRLPDGNFTRFRMDAPEYKTAKELRGRGSANDRRFKLLTILCGSTKVSSNEEKERKLTQFLTVFPNYVPLVKQLDVELAELYTVVYVFYIMYFRDRKQELVEQSFKKFLHRIQDQLYFPIIKQQRLRMTKERVIAFILEQDPAQVMHLMKCLRELKAKSTKQDFDDILTYFD
jgi:hypothetical protein